MMPTEEQQYNKLLNNILLKELEDAAKADKDDPTGEAKEALDPRTRKYFKDTLTQKQITELIGPEHRLVLEDEIIEKGDEIHLGGLCGHYEWSLICKSNIGFMVHHSLIRRKK